MSTQTEANGIDLTNGSQTNATRSRGSSWSPLPSPAELSEYERLVPGATAGFMKLLEREQSLRAQARQSRRDLEAEAEQAGRRYALIVWLTGVGMAIFAVVAAVTVNRTSGDLGRWWVGLLVVVAVQLLVTLLGSRSFLASRREEAIK